MNLVINAITLVDLTNREAKKVNFKEGKNFLTSEGNHYGKSVVMKSIYYTLGAEVYFPKPIKQLNFMTRLDFQLNEISYSVYRLKSVFLLFKKNRFVGKYGSVGEFGNVLSRIFEFEIDLVGKDEDGTIVKCPPAIYFLPYYVDQENGWAVNSFSFNNMTQFDKPQRKDSYFFHLGVFDENYVSKKRKQKSNNRTITKLEQENNKLYTVIDTLKEGVNDTDLSFDMEDLEGKIKIRQNDINVILNDLTKIRKDLVEAEDSYFKALNEKDILSKYIKKKISVDEIEEQRVECPRCGLFFESSSVHRMEKIYLLESLNDDYTAKAQECDQLEKRIYKYKIKFDEKQEDLKRFEKSLNIEKDVYNTYLKTKATKNLLDEYYLKMTKNKEKILELQKSNCSIREILEDYTKDRKKTNETYLSKLDVMLIKLDIPKSQVEDNSEPGTSIEAPGAYGPRCKVAQILSFLETQKEVANNITTFPVVIDSPNVLEQDKHHLDSVLKTLLTWDKTDNQIIVASIEGKDLAKRIKNVNIIDITGKVNHIMNREEYLMLEDEITNAVTKF